MSFQSIVQEALRGSEQPDYSGNASVIVLGKIGVPGICEINGSIWIDIQAKNVLSSGRPLFFLLFI